jgi:CHAT domain-containing protein
MCDTQKGIPVGDTVMSLPLAFFQAGAPSVIASLWEVDDEATALLMRRFYENYFGQFSESRSLGASVYRSGKAMPKGDALGEAKQWLRRLNREDVRRLRMELQSEGDSARSHGSGESEVRGARLAPESENDYSDPYYWAAFVLIGDGGPLN